MPKVGKMLIVRACYRTRSVPNENNKKGVSTTSECGLCRVEFTDLFDRRADLDEDTRLEIICMKAQT